ncbi:MAG: O-antigen ligase family protein [Actinomycetota bacterium]
MASKRSELIAAALAAGASVVCGGVLAALGGGMRPVDWIPYALLLSMAVACLAVLVDLTVTRLAAIALGGFVGLAGWQAASAAWSPFPGAARDEALLTLAYALAFAAGALGVRSHRGRIAATALVAAVAAALAVGTAIRLGLSGDPEGLFFGGRRLGSPIDYPNAQAAAFLVGFWPAAVLAAQRSLPVIARGLAAGGAASMVAGWLMTQSRGASIAFAASALVVFVVSPTRLRLLPPVLLATVPALLSYRVLTEPFRADEEAAAEAMGSAGDRALAVAVAVVVAGCLYALLDRRLQVGRRGRIAATAVVGAAIAAALVVGAVELGPRLGDPAAFVQDQWAAWKHPPEREGSSYLLTVGSGRYDVWRVALEEGREHPVAGLGARGFVSAYLVEGRTGDTPHRAHSVWLDALAETGVVGLALLLIALVPPVVAALRRARTELVAVGTLGTTAYWMVHAGGDWIWTVPAVTLPFAALLGTSVAAPNRPRAATRASLGPLVAVGVLLLAGIVLAPPWLSARLTTSAAGASPDAAEARLRWAERLDPLAVSPLVMRARLAAPEAAPALFEEAVAREPRSAPLHYLAGRAYLRVGRTDEALAHLVTASELAPNDRPIRQALRAARARG